MKRCEGIGANDAEDLLERYFDFMEDFRKEADRGAVLVAAAVIDDLLERTLLAYLLENESAKAVVQGFNAPLGTLAARLAAAHAMGLLRDSEKHDCELIRKIRNEFAHELNASFDDEKIKAYCKRLRYARDHERDARNRFRTSAERVLLWMSQRPYASKNVRLKPQIWDLPAKGLPGVPHASKHRPK